MLAQTKVWHMARFWPANREVCLLIFVRWENFALYHKKCFFAQILVVAHAFSCAYIELWMHLRSLKSTTLTHFSCSPNLPRASATWYTHAKHEQILKWLFWKACQLPSSSSIILSNTPVSIQADLQGEQTKSPSIWKRKILSGTVLSCSLLELF